MPQTTPRMMYKWLAARIYSSASDKWTASPLREKPPVTAPACRYCGGEVPAVRTGRQARWCSTDHWIEDVNFIL